MDAGSGRSAALQSINSMFSIWSFFWVALFVQWSQTCQENGLVSADPQQDFEGLTSSNIYPFYPIQLMQTDSYYKPYQGYFQSERRSPVDREYSNYFRQDDLDYDNPDVEGRVNHKHWGGPPFSHVFNNRITSGNNHFANLVNRFSITRDSISDQSLGEFASCTALTGETGTCSSAPICLHLGGRPSGYCHLKGVCCVNTVNNCGATISLNNTYWQSPSTIISSSSTCAVTIKVDKNKKLTEHKKSICQIRLDFISFSIAQPIGGHCTDSFRVGGFADPVSPICGDNNGQHVYLQVPDYDTQMTNLQLEFNFRAKSINRVWNIKIAMLPCGASYLAPLNCLQYFTSSAGKFSSFNWRDVASTAGIRQLNNQNYNICFRTEIIDSQKADKMCISVCTTTMKGAQPFLLTGSSQHNHSASILATSYPVSCHYPSCLTDFIHFLAGYSGTVSSDRFCGAALNPVPGAGNTQVCSSIKPFRITYITNDYEPIEDVYNQGFCLHFQQF